VTDGEREIRVYVLVGDPHCSSRALAAAMPVRTVSAALSTADHLRLRGSASDSALDTLLERGLIEHNANRLLVTTRAFLDCAGLRDVADLPPLPDGGVADS
jgi:Segregation and condensation complex subunit ScpB